MGLFILKSHYLQIQRLLSKFLKYITSLSMYSILYFSLSDNESFDKYNHLLETVQTKECPSHVVLRNLSIKISSVLDFECFPLSEL